MRKKWEIGLSLLLAASMIPGTVPITTKAAQSAVVQTTQKETQKKETEGEQKYAEGEAIILYDNADAAVKKFSQAGALGSDISVVETYDFDTSDNAKALNSTSANDKGFAVSLVKSDKYTTEELVEKLKKNNKIKYAEPNYRIKATDVDSYADYQWGLDNKGQNAGMEGFDVNADAEALKNTVNDEEKVIALVDTGIDYEHEDLEAAVWNNPVESKQLKGTHGYDFINYDEDPWDDNGHGSHCSGIMAATADNGVGIAGVADNDNIKIMALKILDEEGYGYGMEAVGAYNYIYKAQQLGVNVVAVNNSWGGSSDEESEILAELIDMVGEAGAISVCAAGNDSSDNDVFETLPANIESSYVITVAASNENDELASFSNYGMSTVDIAAPGTNILSSVSYYSFNPVIYDNKDELCSMFQDFTSGNLVNVTENGSFTDNAYGEDDIIYGLDCGNADVSVSLTEDTYFGQKEDNAKSLQFDVRNAEAGEIYTLYLPYTAEKSLTDLYNSIMVKTSGSSDYCEDDFFGFYFSSTLMIADSTIEDGVYNEDEEIYITELSFDEANYWSHCSSKITGKITSSEQRAIAIYVIPVVDGDFTVYLDGMGVSKSGVYENEFGKYDFYNGTSMATPHVTAAVAAVANAFEDENALERKARILGSTRKSYALDGMVATGGVLDLSKAENPNMSIDSVSMNEDNQIEIYGHYFEDAVVTINNEIVEIIEQSKDCIIVDGQDYVNKNMYIQLEKDDDILTVQYFCMTGKSFESAGEISDCLDGGCTVSSGEKLYYINSYGEVSEGIPCEYDGLKQMEWSYVGGEYEPGIFGDSYSLVVDYSLTNTTDIVYCNGKLWTELFIDAGYSEDKALVQFDEENGWEKVAEIPEEFAELNGVTLTSYDGKIYLIGGFDVSEETCSTKVMYFDEDEEVWVEATELPEGRCYAKALQTGNKLVLTLGGSGEDEEPKTMVYDGKTWTVSKANMGNVINYDTYYYEMKDGQFPIYNAQIGIVKDGIVYTNIKVEGVGDTFIYDVLKDEYKSTGYCLNADSLSYDYLFATTVQNDLYVLYGEMMEYDYDEDWYWKNKNSDWYEDDWYEDLFEIEGNINVISMPVQSGFIKVVDESTYGAYVEGVGCYLPGNTIKLEAKAYEDSYIKSFTVGGKKVSGNTYTLKAAESANDIKVCAEAGVYVSYLFIDEYWEVSEAEAALGTSFSLEVYIIPTEAENAKLTWTSSNKSVATVDANGKITISKNAKAGQSAVIRVTAADRGTVYEECTIYITESDASPVPAKNKKVKIGDFTYKVVKSAAKNGTVTCVSFNNKKATKAKIPATVKINGYTFKVTGIAKNAFKNCKKLKSITVGKNVTSIGKNAWKGCSKLKKVTIKSKKVKKFGKGLFNGISKNAVIKVPKKVKNTYAKKIKKAGFSGKVK